MKINFATYTYYTWWTIETFICLFVFISLCQYLREQKWKLTIMVLKFTSDRKTSLEYLFTQNWGVGTISYVFSAASKSGPGPWIWSEVFFPSVVTDNESRFRIPFICVSLVLFKKCTRYCHDITHTITIAMP